MRLSREKFFSKFKKMIDVFLPQMKKNNKKYMKLKVITPSIYETVSISKDSYIKVADNLEPCIKVYYGLYFKFEIYTKKNMKYELNIEKDRYKIIYHFTIVNKKYTYDFIFVKNNFNFKLNYRMGRLL